MTPELSEEVARRFALLGDPTRLRILHTLMEQGELSVAETAAGSGTSRFNTSAHLNRLALGGLVVCQHAGTIHYYRVSDSSLRQVCDSMCNAIRERVQTPTS